MCGKLSAPLLLSHFPGLLLGKGGDSLSRGQGSGFQGGLDGDTRVGGGEDCTTPGWGADVRTCLLKHDEPAGYGRCGHHTSTPLGSHPQVFLDASEQFSSVRAVKAELEDFKLKWPREYEQVGAHSLGQ
eukprot:357062-Chlamydomonas_euryale.AAC.6